MGSAEPSSGFVAGEDVVEAVPGPPREEARAEAVAGAPAADGGQQHADALHSLLVAVPTLGKRPLLPLLERLVQELRAVRRRGCVGAVVLLDNSPGLPPSLRAAAASMGVHYRHVTARGFSQVRNAALDAAGRFDALVFIDDDELPCRGWLEALVTSAESHHADVVVGPVLLMLPPSAPRWLAGGTVLRPRRRQPDGPLRGNANSGNTLIRMSTVRRLGARFDPAFNTIGGEDTVFFGQLAQRGATLVWAGTAEAVEAPDPERLAVSYVVRRAYRGGRIMAVTARLVTGETWSAVPRRVGRICRGLLRLVLGGVCGRSSVCVLGLLDLSFTLGWFVTVAMPRGRQPVIDCRVWQSYAGADGKPGTTPAECDAPRPASGG